MQPTDPLPRLLRLHGMAAGTAPDGKQKTDHSDAIGLIEAYEKLRAAIRALVSELHMSLQEFDAELPSIGPPPSVEIFDPREMLERAAMASRAATGLRALRGYLEGLITMTAITEDLTPEQIELIRSIVSH